MPPLRELRLLEAIAKVEADGKPDSPLALALLELKKRREAGNQNTKLWISEDEKNYIVGAETNESLEPAHGILAGSDLPVSPKLTKFNMGLEKKA